MQSTILVGFTDLTEPPKRFVQSGRRVVGSIRLTRLHSDLSRVSPSLVYFFLLLGLTKDDEPCSQHTMFASKGLDFLAKFPL